MATQQPEAASPEQHVFLVGRPPLGEFLGFIRVRAVGGQDVDIPRLAEEWREANDHIQELEEREPGWADNPEVRPIPEDLAPSVERLQEDPVYQRAFRIIPSTLGVVELDRLVVYQKHINLAYVEVLKAGVGETPTQEHLFEFCLPGEPSQPPVRLRQMGQNAYTFVSRSDDLRFLGTVLLDPEEVPGHQFTGRPYKILAAAVGYSSNYLNALHFQDRLVLNNGSHRAYALRDLGITEVPCVIQNVTRKEELEVIGSPVTQQMDMYFEEPRPPVLKDYFDSQLRKVVPVTQKRRAVQVQVQTGKQDTPA